MGIVSELDEIAWLFNLRAQGDTNKGSLFHSPVFESVALVTQEEIYLFLHGGKWTEEISNHLEGVYAETYERLYELLPTRIQQHPNETFLVTKPSMYLGGVNYALYDSVPEKNRNLGDSPILLMKMIKNEVEISGMMEAHIKDAVALCTWAQFMENEVQVLGNTWTELGAAEKLRQKSQAV